MKSKISLFIVICLILNISVLAYGVGTSERIEANVANDMGFKLDGKAWQPKDLDGSVLAPIIYKDRSYVPVRALLEEKGVNVSFANDTRTIILDFPKKELDKSSPMLMNVIDPIGQDKKTKTIEIAPNKDFDYKGIAVTNETSMILAQDSVILLNGIKYDVATLAKSQEKIEIASGKVSMEYDPMTKSVTSVQSATDGTDIQNFTIIVHIEILHDPLRIKITIIIKD